MFMKFIPKTGNFPLDYAIRNPHSCLHFASFFKFMHANVSATFIVIRALPYNCVYRNPWFSFAVPKILSIVSFLCEYSSFIPSVCWGSCQGVIGEGETLISTGTRNFKGRAGHKDSFVYLASAATVTASAIKGEIATADMV